MELELKNTPYRISGNIIRPRLNRHFWYFVILNFAVLCLLLFVIKWNSTDAILVPILQIIGGLVIMTLAGLTQTILLPLLWKIEFSRHQISLVSLGQGTLLSKLNFPEKKNIEQVNIDRIRIEQDNDPKTEMLFDLCLDLKNKEVIKLMKFNLSELFIKLEQVISIGTQIAEFYNIEFEMDDKYAP